MSNKFESPLDQLKKIVLQTKESLASSSSEISPNRELDDLVSLANTSLNKTLEAIESAESEALGELNSHYANKRAAHNLNKSQS